MRPESISRRRFLRNGAQGLALTAGAGALAGCGGQAPIKLQSGVDPAWQQFAGTTLNFISENTAPTAAIAANLAPFQTLTGIRINIVRLQLSSMVQKIALDIAAGQGAYQLIYADPYQVLAPYREALADLHTFTNDDSLPQIPKGLDDFIDVQLDATGRFGSADSLRALPYDCPTMIWMYRRDLFEKYGERMAHDLGFDPTPSDRITWEQYYRIAKWFNDNQDEVPYGCGQQAKQHDSLMCDFSNVLWSYGGDYFPNGDRVGRLGTAHPGESLLGRPESIEAAAFYRKLNRIAHPGSTAWDWTGLANAFAAGQVAMAPNWHEFAADMVASLGQENVGYSPLPRGPAGTSNHFGGTGIGISGAATVREQKAAWLFLVWATSPDVQLMGLKSDEGGGTPTRSSVYRLPQAQRAMEPHSKLPNLLTYSTVSTAWQADHIGLRPKIPAWNRCDTVIFTELSKMLVAGQSPEVTMRTAGRRFDQATSTVDPG